ncbi:glutamate receptor 2-like isoform X2 [Mya arenaria]|uniref:glutamate receptor 2-like isoform X2 n=1 Tax=Mya arenaria TaxID=6604 RepID=UPI0022E9426E|nr:glutamate receptor 2-like isoform X2 [Mya arenaria]
MDILDILLKYLFVLVSYCFMFVTMDKRDPMNIGVILGNTERQNVLRFAWVTYREKYSTPNAMKLDIDDIDISNSHLLISKLCKHVAKGSIMMVADYNPLTYGSVQSYAHYLNVPTLVPGGTGSGVHGNYRYDVRLLPPTIDAISDVIKYFQWNSIVYYLFDTNDGLLRLQQLFDSFESGDFYTPVIRPRRIANISDCYDVLRRIDRGKPPLRIVLDLSGREAYEQVLHQIVDVGMNRDGYHYVLGGLGIDELDLGTFVYGGVNITGFSIVDKFSTENAELISKAQEFTLHPVGKITVEKALVIDTIHVLVLAAQSLTEDATISINRGRYQRVGSKLGSTDCSGETLQQTFDGEMVLRKLKNVKTYGLTGNIEFNEYGARQNYLFKVYQLELKKPLRQVGFWTPNRGLNTTLPKPPERPNISLNRTLRVITILEEPFVQYKKNNDGNGAPRVDGKYLEGYCIDLAKMLQEKCDTPYDYYIDLVGDSSYGTWYKDEGCWDGMIGELLDTRKCPKGGERKKADMAIAPLTINEERQRVVDFTKPFMKTGISIMIKKPDKEKPGIFSFMYPLSNLVWACVMLAFVGVSLVLFFVGRWSPLEWAEQDPKGGTPINNFNLLNTLWFTLGALMQQGSDTFPRSYSGRIVGSAWWFFTLILISSYTANLAAFLTIERLTPPINSADELVRHPKIKYGTLSRGSSRAFFKESKVDTYKKMWNHMSAHEERVMVNSTLSGVTKVRNSKGEYAFLMEEAYNKFHNQRRPCNTMRVGNNLDNKGYGIATPIGFYLKNQINVAVLKLREVGELMKLEQKWWYSKGECGVDTKDAKTSALTLSNVSGVFHILIGGLLLAMVMALCEYLLHQRLRNLKKKSRENKFTYPSPGSTTAASAHLVTFDNTKYSFTSSPDH